MQALCCDTIFDKTSGYICAVTSNYFLPINLLFLAIFTLIKLDLRNA